MNMNIHKNIKQLLAEEDLFYKENKEDENKENLEPIESIFMIKLKHVSGWVRTVRSSSQSLTFCVINDGSNVDGLQIVLNSEIMDETYIEDFNDRVSTGSYIECQGTIGISPAQGQDYEMQMHNFQVIGSVETKYPLAKGKINLDTLRNYYHLRGRTNTFGSVFRIRSALMKYSSQFFDKHEFLHLDPNIITINDCEGGGEAFKVTEQDFTVKSDNPEQGKYTWNNDHFRRPAYLTVSSQLQLEAMACSLGNCYTMNKSFRAEHSNTRKHLSEFTHLEIEMIQNSMEDLMNIGEEYIKFCIKQLLTHHKPDIENLNAFVSKGLLNRLETIISQKFIIITYHDVVSEVNQDIMKQQLPLELLKMGDDLSAKHEDYITQKYNNGVFVTKWPMSLKSFYMKQDEQDDTCYSFDLLMPYGIGEIIGGSQREENYEKLMNMMEKKGMNQDNLSFYTDLRKYGTCPHGGFGLGFERLCMLTTGMNNIRDVVPFPVCYESCNY